MQFRLPDFDTVVEIHSIVLEGWGGLDGMPHPEFVHSAIQRPQNYMHYVSDCDVHLISAIILDSIARYHAFADGNKRTALLSMLLTYRMNGIKIAFTLMTNQQLEKLVIDVADNKKQLTIRQLRYRLKRIIEKHIPVE